MGVGVIKESFQKHLKTRLGGGGAKGKYCLYGKKIQRVYNHPCPYNNFDHTPGLPSLA